MFVLSSVKDARRVDPVKGYSAFLLPRDKLGGIIHGYYD